MIKRGGFRVGRRGVGLRYASSGVDGPSFGAVFGRIESVGEEFGKGKGDGDVRSVTELDSVQASLFHGIAEAFKAIPPKQGKGRTKPSLRGVSLVKNADELTKELRKLFNARDYYVCSSFYVKSTSPTENRFDPDRSSYLYAIAACGKTDYSMLGNKLLEELEKKGIVPHELEYRSILEACSNRGELHLCLDIIERMKQMGLKPSVDCYNQVLLTMCRNGQMTSAERIVNEMTKQGVSPNQDTYEALVNGHVSVGKFSSAMEQLKKGESALGIMHPVTYVNILGDLAENVSTHMVAELLRKLDRAATRYKLEDKQIPLGLYSSLICAASRHLDGKLSLSLWSKMRRQYPDNIAQPAGYSAVNCLGRLGRFEDAFEILQEMSAAGVKPSIVNLRGLVRGCKKSPKEADRAYYLLSDMKAQGKTVNLPEVNVILNACAEMGDIDRTYQTFEALQKEFGLKPSIESFNALFTAVRMSGQLSKVQSILLDMKQQDLRPNSESFEILTMALQQYQKPQNAVAMVETGVGTGIHPTKKTLAVLQRKAKLDMRDDQPEAERELGKKVMAFGFRYRNNRLFVDDVAPKTERMGRVDGQGRTSYSSSPPVRSWFPSQERAGRSPQSARGASFRKGRSRGDDVIASTLKEPQTHSDEGNRKTQSSTERSPKEEEQMVVAKEVAEPTPNASLAEKTPPAGEAKEDVEQAAS
ncbi:hypothetical protein NDN08_000516 [Rhodosorus marinus]|uniref:Pentatricopeptide repeat-containing protein-mitochondrial domain-containing protein n=1 Tax=Rhodosorus marinus TaxID=101924 RepID=A0AAV8UTT1_9RHOD|nr:hypothetical protein NDN08_000516 [Rhodosorus marinus]